MNESPYLGFSDSADSGRLMVCNDKSDSYLCAVVSPKSDRWDGCIDLLYWSASVSSTNAVYSICVVSKKCLHLMCAALCLTLVCTHTPRYATARRWKRFAGIDKGKSAYKPAARSCRAQPAQFQLILICPQTRLKRTNILCGSGRRSLHVLCTTCRSTPGTSQQLQLPQSSTMPDSKMETRDVSLLLLTSQYPASIEDSCAFPIDQSSHTYPVIRRDDGRRTSGTGPVSPSSCDTGHYRSVGLLFQRTGRQPELGLEMEARSYSWLAHQR